MGYWVLRYTGITLLGVVGLLFGCTPKATVARYNMDHLYAEEAPITLRHHLLDSREYMRVYLDFTFRKLAAGSRPEDAARRYKASYRLIQNYDSQQVLGQDTLDLARLVSVETLGGMIPEFALAFNIKKPAMDRVGLIILVEDRLLPGQPILFDVPIELARAEKQYRYLLFNRNGTRPLYSGFSRVGDTVSVRSLSVEGKPLYLRVYSEGFPAALPPMAVPATVTAGSVPGSGPVYKINQNSLIVLNQPGVYQITEDTTADPGMVVLVEPNQYPRLTKAPELVSPLIYMTTRSERGRLLGAKNPKLELDRFWMDVTGNRDFARKVIKAYYENVEYANTWFSDYREGWKTDRGMVFVVFGKPGTVLRKGNVEEWRYEERASTPEIRFVFEKKAAPLGQQSWELRRSGDYDRYWYATVDQWRKGIIRR